MFDVMKNNLDHIIIKTLLGLLFCISAVLKLISIDEFELYIYSYGFFSLNTSFLIARITIGLELALGTGFLINQYHKLFRLGYLLSLIGFSAVLIYAIAVGRTDNCHCFGEAFYFNPVQSLIKNLVLLLLVIILGNNIKPYRFKGVRLLCWLLVVASFATPFIVSPPDSFIPEFKESSAHINSDNFYNIADSSALIQSNLFKDKKIVGFYSTGCNFCKLTASKMSSMLQRHNIPESDVIYIFFGDSLKVQNFYSKTFSLSYPYLLLPPKELLEMTNGRIPLIVLLDNGTIVKEYDYRSLNENEIRDFFAD